MPWALVVPQKCRDETRSANAECARALNRETLPLIDTISTVRRWNRILKETRTKASKTKASSRLEVWCPCPSVLPVGVPQIEVSLGIFHAASLHPSREVKSALVASAFSKMLRMSSCTCFKRLAHQGDRAGDSTPNLPSTASRRARKIGKMSFSSNQEYPRSRHDSPRVIHAEDRRSISNRSLFCSWLRRYMNNFSPNDQNRRYASSGDYSSTSTQEKHLDSWGKTYPLPN